MEREDVDLGSRITELWAHISAAKCEGLGLVAEFDAQDGCAADGFASTADWVAYQCSISPGAAREYVRVARRLVELPKVRDAFSRGELSYSMARALTRVIGMDDDALLVQYGRAATAAQLERIVAGYRRVTSSDATAQHDARFLDVIRESDGSVTIRGRLCAEEGALLLRALEQSEQSLFDAEPAAGRDRSAHGTGGDRSAHGTGDVSAETREALAQTAPAGSVCPTAPQRRADALVGLADRALASGAAQRTGGERCQVVVHVDVDALVDVPETPAPVPRVGVSPMTADGAVLARETARRLCCDAGLVVTTEREGQTIDVGRRRRTIPPSIRRALESRQHCCGFPGCERTRWLDAHHITHWADGGATRLDNLVRLCGHHHRLLHEGGFSITARASGALEFCDAQAHPLAAVPLVRTHGDCRAVTEARRVSAGALRPTQGSDPWDFRMTVESLADRRIR